MNSDMQQTSLSLIINEAANRAAKSFAEMTKFPVNVQLSRAELIDSQLAEILILPGDVNWGSAVHIHFDGNVSGESLLLLPSGHDTSLMAALVKQLPGLADAQTSQEVVITEIGNVLINACVGTVANHFGWHVIFQIPESINSSDVTLIINPSSKKPMKLIRMLSTLGVGGIEVNMLIILIFFTQIENLNP